MSISVSSASIASLKVGGSGVSSVMLGGDVVYSSAGFSPASLSGLSLWLDAEKLAGTVEAIPPADGSLLSSWACRAHAGHSLVQPTATYQPEYLSEEPYRESTASAWLRRNTFIPKQTKPFLKS